MARPTRACTNYGKFGIVELVRFGGTIREEVSPFFISKSFEHRPSPPNNWLLLQCYTKTMSKTFWVIAAAVVVIILAVGIFLSTGAQNPKTAQTSPASFDPLNATYSIEGQSVTFVNGASETPDATTKIFGQPVLGNLDGDGKPDASVFIYQQSGGTGTFYYVAAAINVNGIAQGTNGIFLGDRIAPQNLEIKNGQIIANYADRAPGEPMAANPSVGVSRYFNYNGTTLVEASSTQ